MAQSQPCIARIASDPRGDSPMSPTLARFDGGGLGALLGEWFMASMVAFCSWLWWIVMTWVVLPLGVLSRAWRGPAPERSFSCILITGASCGIGAALAKAYARPGVRLVLLARRAERLAEVKALCEAKGATVKLIRCDVTDQRSMENQILAADKERPIDLVIANAGVHEAKFYDRCDSYLSGALGPVTSTNVMGVANTIAPIIDRMVARKSGQIAIMSSVASLVVFPDSAWAAYCASKAWARTYGLSLRGAVQRHGVGVTVLCPGFIQSETLDQLLSQQPLARRIAQRTALRVDDAVARMQCAIARNVAVLVIPCNLGLLNIYFFATNIIPPSVLSFMKRHMPTLEQPRPESAKAASRKAD